MADELDEEKVKISQQVIAWAEENSVLLDELMRHFEMTGKPFKDKGALIVDMLSDVVDVWLDTHKNWPCESCLEDKRVQEESK